MNKYYIAFDNALIAYHQERMQHVNKVIRGLWRRIYTGNDIDTIEIKAEQDVNISGNILLSFLIIELIHSIYYCMKEYVYYATNNIINC